MTPHAVLHMLQTVPAPGNHQEFPCLQMEPGVPHQVPQHPVPIQGWSSCLGLAPNAAGISTPVVSVPSQPSQTLQTAIPNPADSQIQSQIFGPSKSIQEALEMHSLPKAAPQASFGTPNTNSRGKQRLCPRRAKARAGSCSSVPSALAATASPAGEVQRAADLPAAPAATLQPCRSLRCSFALLSFGQLLP